MSYHILFSQSFAFVVCLFLVVVGFSKMVPFSQYLIAQFDLSLRQYRLCPGSKKLYACSIFMKVTNVYDVCMCVCVYVRLTS